MNVPNSHHESNLGALLRRLHAGARDVAPLPADVIEPSRQVDPSDDLAAHFMREAEAAGWSVHDARGRDWRAVVATLLDDVASFAASAPCVWWDPELDAPPPQGVAATDALDDETFFTVAVSVTTVRAAIAETGSVVWESGPGRPRIATLAPPAHVAVLRAVQIVPDLVDYFAALDGGALPANINLITGPSKTADIEGTLVRGVHGPGRVYVVLTD